MNRKKPIQLLPATSTILDEMWAALGGRHITEQGVERTVDHEEIERAAKHAIKDGVFDFIRSDAMVEAFKKSLNIDRLQTKGLADIPWKDYFQKALMNVRVAKWLEKFADDLADEAMRHVGEDVGGLGPESEPPHAVDIVVGPQ